MAASSDADAPATAESHAQEGPLWRAFKRDGSVAAREKLFELHFPLARKIAIRHFRDRTSGDIELADLTQFACVGLLEAIDHYDPERGTPFPAFARRRITGSLLDGIAKASELREQLSFRRRVRKARTQSLSPSDPDRLTLNEVFEAMVEIATGLAVGFMLDDAQGMYVDGDERDPQPNAYQSVVWNDTLRRAMAELGTLPAREQAIIRHHYLSGLTFDQIGDLLGIGKARVSQIHRAALALLRKRLTNSAGFKLER